MKNYCSTCKRVTKHDTIVENFVGKQRQHQMCLTCGHSNSYKERSRQAGYPIIKEWKRNGMRLR